MKLFIKDAAFYKEVAKIAIPIALQGLITSGVSMMDTVMVGALGETQLSAVSLATQFIHIFHILCMGIGMGASVLVARYYGQKDGDALKKTLSIMLRLCLSLSLIFTAVTALFPRPIMCIFTDVPAIIDYGVKYLEYMTANYFFFGLSLTCTIVLRNVGQVRLPLYTSIGAFFVNVGANYIFIFGKLGAPAMGVAGAALGTVIARLFEFGMICGYLFFFDKEIGFRLRHLFAPVGKLWKEYIRISIPVLVSDGILALGNSSVSMVIGRLGESFVAANAVTSATRELSSVMIQGASQSGAIITGHTLGRGERDKAQAQGYAFLGLGLAFGLLTALIILAISGPIIGAYNLSAQTQDITWQLMWSISLVTLFQATNSIMTKGVLRGGGDTRMLMLTDNIFLWAAALPLGMAAGLWLGLPPFWIYFALKFDQVIKAFWCLLRLRSGKWIKKIRNEQEING